MISAAGRVRGRRTVRHRGARATASGDRGCQHPQLPETPRATAIIRRRSMTHAKRP